MVSLHELKSMVRTLEPTCALRILVLGEPDVLPRSEYASKVVGWYRLVLSRAD